MSVLQALFLGIIQGLTEFLPVSSSGHLVLFQKIFGVSGNPVLFDIILHLGTLTSVCIVFRDDIIALLRRPFQRLTWLLALATLPAVAAALAFDEQIKILFEGGLLLALAFLLTCALLIAADKLKSGGKDIADMSFWDALLIGLMQALAIPPGVSRSGSTIAGALFAGMSRGAAARFSFLLSIPAILGGLTKEIMDCVLGGAFMHVGLDRCLFGFLAAALTGYLSIGLTLKLVRECKLRYFAYYVFALAALIALDATVTHKFF